MGPQPTAGINRSPRSAKEISSHSADPQMIEPPDLNALILLQATRDQFIRLTRFPTPLGWL